MKENQFVVSILNSQEQLIIHQKTPKLSDQRMKSRKKECHNGIFSPLFTTSNKTAQFYFWLKMTTIRQSEIRGVYLGATCNRISRSSLMRKMELVTFITVTFCSTRNVWSISHNFMEIFHGNKMIKRNGFPVSTHKEIQWPTLLQSDGCFAFVCFFIFNSLWALPTGGLFICL